MLKLFSKLPTGVKVELSSPEELLFLQIHHIILSLGLTAVFEQAR